MIHNAKQFIRKKLSHLRNRLTMPVQPPVEHVRRTIPCDSGAFSLVSESNALFHVTTATDDGYFCPCRRHTPLDVYVRDFVDDYYNFITDAPAFAATDRQMILDSLSDPACFHKFTQMSSPIVPHSPLARFLSESDPALIGLCFDTSDTALLCRIRRFVSKFAWCQLNTWYLHQALPYGHWQTRSFCISLATAALARLLEMEDMFPHAEYAWLQIDGQKPLFGLFANAASGSGVIAISHERRAAMMTPDLQRAFSRLSVIDAITHEMDHSPNNYNIVFNPSGMAVGLSVFDNNGIGTFSLRRSAAFATYKNCSPFLRSDGTVNRPYLDAAVCRLLKDISFSRLFHALRPFLRFPQILFVWIRQNSIISAINKSAAVPGILLEKAQWSEETIHTELSGIYGKTYLVSYLQDCCVPSE